MSAPITTVAARQAVKPAILTSTANSLLRYWHLLSLDAPTVAVVWTIAFAHVSRVRLPWLAPCLLALATWLLYVADRLLDGLRLTTENVLQERHYFHRRHRAAFLATSLPLVAILSWLVASHMDPAPRMEEMLLAGAAALYLLLVHLPRHSRSAGTGWAARLSSKEAAVGIIFAAACIIPSWSRSTAAHPWLLLTGILFAGLCWLNCVFIDASESQPSPFHPLRKAAGCLVSATVAVSLAEIGSRQWPFALLSLCVLLSTAFLLRLDHHRSSLAPVQLRALADAVLLTPLLLLPVLHSG